MDYTTLGGALFGFVGALVVIYLVRKQRQRTIIGLGGPLLLLGFILLGIAYGLIPVVIVWVLTAVAVGLLVIFSYLALRPGSVQPSASAKEAD